MTEIPDAAVTAAAKAFHEAVCPGQSCGVILTGFHLERAKAALEAAAPHTTDARWTALKDFLAERRASADLYGQSEFIAGEAAALIYALAKMEELEAGQ
jgi:hypothetical protein